MLISRDELRFDFQGATFDLARAPEKFPSDKKLLAWIFSQFLYGEVTGIQCGHWLYRAPTIGAATFLAKQATEELSHVRKFLRIFSLMGEQPQRAHWAVRFLSTGMMGGTWGEHVAIEMALGEGLVLAIFYALVDTIPDPDIHRILESAAGEEERHVEFGERETQHWLAAHPEDRSFLLGMACVQAWALRRLKSFITKRLGADGHPVLGQFEKLFEHVIRTFELRVSRLGLSDQPIGSMSLPRKVWIVSWLPWRLLKIKLSRRAPMLTETYLQDSVIKEEFSGLRVKSNQING